MENNTAKHFVLQLGSLVSLYLSLGFLLTILFGVINLSFPAATDTLWDSEEARNSIRVGIAFVIVFYPAYVILTRTVNRLRRKQTDGKYLSLTKWLIYLSLLVGGGILLGDLVAIIMAYLNGELTERFLLKAAAVLITVGLAFFYYVRDAQGYWLKAERHSIWFAVLTTVVVSASLFLGVTNIETPQEVREQRIDAAQVTDLQTIQWQIQEYLTINGVVPASLEALSGAVSLPTAPKERSPYRYEVTERGFNLCATFATETPPDQFLGMARPIAEKGVIINSENWQHKAGDFCFERIVSTGE
jgi:hypothetical protein